MDANQITRNVYTPVAELDLLLAAEEETDACVRALSLDTEARRVAGDVVRRLALAA